MILLIVLGGRRVCRLLTVTRNSQKYQSSLRRGSRMYCVCWKGQWVRDLELETLPVDVVCADLPAPCTQDWGDVHPILADWPRLSTSDQFYQVGCPFAALCEDIAYFESELD